MIMKSSVFFFSTQISVAANREESWSNESRLNLDEKGKKSDGIYNYQTHLNGITVSDITRVLISTNFHNSANSRSAWAPGNFCCEENKLQFEYTFITFHGNPRTPEESNGSVGASNIFLKLVRYVHPQLWTLFDL